MEGFKKKLYVYIPGEKKQHCKGNDRGKNIGDFYNN
jgi:hypothetical protein